MSEFVYEVIVSVDLAKVVEPVADVVKDLNVHLSKMGLNEQITVRNGEFRLFTLTSGHEITTKEIDDMKAMIQDAVDRISGNRLDLRVSDIRKSFGKSCSKST